MLHQDRLLPADPGVRRIARRLHEHVRSLPIVSPHGHCDPVALADDAPLGDPAAELVTSDHYLLRMLSHTMLTIPARHDMARRVDAGYLAGLVAEHRLDEAGALDVADDLAHHLARRSFHLDRAGS